MTRAGWVRKAFDRIHRLDHDQVGLTAETWAAQQPVRRVRIAGRSVMLSQPASTFWVYALGVLTCAVGYRFSRLVPGEPVLQLWSAGLWLWGIGAILAGTSYQAFGYHLKCRDGRVRWTTWWEAVYMICQQLSIDVLLAATAMLTTTGALRRSLVVVAVLTGVGFTVLTLVGAFLPNRRLLSFAWMCGVSAPMVLLMLGLHAGAVLRSGDALDWALAGVWSGLVACMAVYVLYLRAGVADRLWARGRWFSENDVLHVALIGWVVGIGATADLFVERLLG